MQRYIQRPNGAYKLLVHLLYGQHPTVFRREQGNLVYIYSVRKLARILGTESGRIHGWVNWLHGAGFIETYTCSSNSRRISLKLRKLATWETPD